MLFRSSLSEREIVHLFALLRSIKEKKDLTVIFISHKLSEVMELSDRATVLRDGSMVGTLDRSEMSVDRLISMMIGRELDYNKHLLSSRAPGETVLRAEGLTQGKRYREISCELHPYEILGMFGLVGAGRTECILGMLGMEHLDAGEVFYCGEKIKLRSPRDAVKNGIYYVTENRKEMGLFLKIGRAHV